MHEKLRVILAPKIGGDDVRCALSVSFVAEVGWAERLGCSDERIGAVERNHAIGDVQICFPDRFLHTARETDSG